MLLIPDFSDLTERIASCSTDDVQQALQVEHPGIHGLAALLSPAASAMLPELARRSSEITLRRFGRTIQLYAPVYLSSFCSNRCAYCGFAADNKLARRVLTMEEAEREMDILHERGFNHVLLVSGEAPAKMGVEYLEELARRTRDRFASITIEVQPLSTEEYARLFEAGITGVAIYQETYDRKVYDQVHLSGNKCDYDFRLESPARVARA
ncbi:MAG: radical SAM protein, partial [Proteobacteria bacterium]|nr:radical SAM protein [Pseudomonadota bacterium]